MVWGIKDEYFDKVYPNQRRKKPMDEIKETQSDQVDVLRALAQDTLKKIYQTHSTDVRLEAIYGSLQQADKHGCQRGIRDASDDGRIDAINKLLAQYGETEHPSFQILNQIAEITGGKNNHEFRPKISNTRRQQQRSEQPSSAKSAEIRPRF